MLLLPPLDLVVLGAVKLFSLAQQPFDTRQCPLFDWAAVSGLGGDTGRSGPRPELGKGNGPDRPGP